MNFACVLFVSLFTYFEFHLCFKLSFVIVQTGKTIVTYKIQNLFSPFVSLRNFHPTEDHAVGCIFLCLVFT